jgi:hypothetical protein
VVIHSHPWTLLHVLTTQENHGGKKRLLRVRFEMRPSGLLIVAGLMGAIVSGVTALLHGWGAVLPLAALGIFCLGVWWRGRQRAAQAAAVFESLGRSLGFFRCLPLTGTACTVPANGAASEDSQQAPEAPVKDCVPSLALQACVEPAPPGFVSEND